MSVRTGRAHRTLMGHTGPITCLQFDEHHIVSGSLDKTVRVSRCKFSSVRNTALRVSLKIWDIRTGGIADTIRFEYPVTSLQFDSRKVVAGAGENGVKVWAGHYHRNITSALSLRDFYRSIIEPPCSCRH
jgi:division protein 1